MDKKLEMNIDKELEEARKGLRFVEMSVDWNHSAISSVNSAIKSAVFSADSSTMWAESSAKWAASSATWSLADETRSEVYSVKPTGSYKEERAKQVETIKEIL